jgi:hypothetical protein
MRLVPSSLVALSRPKPSHLDRVELLNLPDNAFDRILYFSFS